MLRTTVGLALLVWTLVFVIACLNAASRARDKGDGSQSFVREMFTQSFARFVSLNVNRYIILGAASISILMLGWGIVHALS